MVASAFTSFCALSLLGKRKRERWWVKEALVGSPTWQHLIRQPFVRLPLQVLCESLRYLPIASSKIDSHICNSQVQNLIPRFEFLILQFESSKNEIIIVVEECVLRYLHMRLYIGSSLSSASVTILVHIPSKFLK